MKMSNMSVRTKLFSGFTALIILTLAIAYAGWDGIQALGRRYARERLPRVLRPEAMARIAWHRSRGDRIVVVSASLDAYLVPWCRAQGLELICSELEVHGDRLTGGYRGGDCTGAAKAARVRGWLRLDDYRRVHAYGDTSEDRELLALAHHPVFRWRGMSIA